MSPSSSGLGHCPFTAATGVRIPLGTPFYSDFVFLLRSWRNGRRAALRSLWGNLWKFESSRPHQIFIAYAFCKTQAMSVLPAHVMPLITTCDVGFMLPFWSINILSSIVIGMLGLVNVHIS